MSYGWASSLLDVDLSMGRINPENNKIDSHYLMLISDPPISQLPKSMGSVLSDGDVVTILTFANGG